MGNTPPNEGYNSEILNYSESDPAINDIENEELKNNSIIISHDGEICTFSKNINQCHSFQRINSILIMYQKWIHRKKNNQNNNKFIPFWNIVNDKNMRYNNSILLDDYHHLIHCHQFQQIYDNLLNKCCIDQHIESYCICLHRNYRDRENKNDSLSTLSTSYFGITDNEINIEQIMDTIHCYFYHSYDLGYLLTKKQTDYVNNKNVHNESNTILNGLSFHSYLNPNNLAFTGSVLKNAKKQRKNKDDVIMKGDYMKIRKIKHILKKKQKFAHFYNDKFVTHILERNDLKNDEEKGYEEMDGIYEEHFVFDDFEDLSIKYEYFNEDKINFVSPKYDSLRDELLNLLTMKQFNILYLKSSNHKNKQHSKYLKSNGKNGIKKGIDIELQHILSIMVYCNFNKIQKLFNSTFLSQNIYKKQTIKDMIKSHENYANFGRYLFEIVHCFGNKTKLKDRFYHIIDSEVYFLSNSYCISYPLSVTNKIQIAMIMNMMNLKNKNKNINNGILIEYKYNIHWDPIQYFNCKSISDFGFENELLFIGNDNISERFMLNKIININYCYDYSIWLIVFNIIYSLINGQQFRTQHLNNKILINVINILKLQSISEVVTDHNKSNLFIFIPNYIKIMMKLFVEKINKITIRWPDINNFYCFIKPFLFDSKYDFINLNILFSIFRNCTHLIINGSLDKKLYFSRNNIECIYAHLLNTNNIKKIEIEWINKASPLSFDAAILEYKQKFKEKLSYNLYINNNDKKWRSLVIEHE